MAPRIISFQDALRETANVKRHLLLGNGFSIALFPDRFQYKALLKEANFEDVPEAQKAFEALQTTDFEVVIKALRDAVTLFPIYGGNEQAVEKMAKHAEVLKELLVKAISGKHPARPSEITEAQYKSCRAFLANFVGASRIIEVNGRARNLSASIYTLNYDLLLYWVLLHDQVINWNADDPLGAVLEQTEHLEHDDGFRAPPDDVEAPYVAWDGEGLASDKQNIHFVHGGLHLFDEGPELQKLCWERSGGNPLVDQIRGALAENKFPLFVSEGTTTGKLSRIRHSGYLQRSLKSFSANCRVEGATLFIVGHSLADNDAHVLRKIVRGKIRRLYVSFFGDPNSDDNKALFSRAEALASGRHDDNPLELTFFDVDTAQIWNAAG